jgi:hypothetical protein
MSRPQYHLWPAVARSGTSSVQSNFSHRTLTQSVASATTRGTAPTVADLRNASIAPVIAPTVSDSVGILSGSRTSTTIRADTPQGGPAGAEKMMTGLPCKANGYWGFCKGAWTIREDQKKGLALRVQPSGLYSTKEVWECRCCSFKGSAFTTTHLTKQSKESMIVDPRTHSSVSGVRYRWICKHSTRPSSLQHAHVLTPYDVVLAKSHIRKKSTDKLAAESKYGCIICSLDDKVTSVYSGVEALMNHIALSHIVDLSENTRRKAKCIIGRMAGSKEDWDINIPVFEHAEELT